MIGSKAQMKLNMGNTAQFAGPKELAKSGAGGSGSGSAISSALGGLSNLMGGQPDLTPDVKFQGMALAQPQQPVGPNGAGFMPIQPRMGMFDRMYQQQNPLLARMAGAAPPNPLVR